MEEYTREQIQRADDTDFIGGILEDGRIYKRTDPKSR